MARKTKQEAEETKYKILDAALDIIYEKGFARSTFVDIANRITHTKGAVYWHFKNKPDMFLALGLHMEEKINHAMEKVFEETTTLDDLKQIIFEMIMLIAEDEQLRKYYSIVFFRMEWTEELLPVKAFFDRQDQLMMEWVAGILNDARAKNQILKEKDIQSLSRALIAFIDGLLSYCLTRQDDKKETVSLVVQTGLDSFFAGFKTQP